MKRAVFCVVFSSAAVLQENDSDLNMVFEVGKFFGEIALTENVPRKHTTPPFGFRQKGQGKMHQPS